MNIVNEIYRLIFNDECEELKRDELDISWIRDKISINDYLKLEEDITAHTIRNEQYVFERGFKCSFHLVISCIKEELSESKLIKILTEKLI